MLKDAVRLAALKHGQASDKGGQPFIGHPLRVMAMVAAEYPDAPECVLEAAVLHDVIEDTGTDKRELERHFSVATILMVELLTRKDGEAYFDYINRIAKSGSAHYVTGIWGVWAKRIKLCDLADNLNPNRRVAGMKLPERYAKAVDILEGRED